MDNIKTKIEEWIADRLAEEDLFLVDIKASATGKIQVFVDGFNNVSIEQCAQLSRFLENYLDAEPGVPESYILEVSSPGMTNGFKVPQQYQKRVGKVLSFVLNDGEKFNAKVLEVLDNGVAVEEVFEEMSKTKMKKLLAEGITPRTMTLDYSDIKKTMIPFSFKNKKQ